LASQSKADLHSHAHFALPFVGVDLYSQVSLFRFIVCPQFCGFFF
jgi:hypothetical protein